MGGIVKIFKIEYEGWWLGGKALVLAEDEESAKRLLVGYDGVTTRQNGPPERRYRTPAEEMQVTEVIEDLSEQRVLYNDNGDY